MSSTHDARPAFGKPIKTQEYYDLVNATCRSLRPMATLRVIAQHLAALGLKTPRGMDWDRQKLATYLRKRTL